jgi:hypothetical protein
MKHKTKIVQVVIRGNQAYATRMMKHLKLEHPSVRGNIFIKKGGKK